MTYELVYSIEENNALFKPAFLGVYKNSDNTVEIIVKGGSINGGKASIIVLKPEEYKELGKKLLEL
jgi:hypothetical protein